MSKDKSQQRKGLKKLYNLHAWVGFHLAIVMFIILATGTIATVSNEIDWLIFPELRATSPSGNDTITGSDWADMYDSLTAAYPDDRISFFYSMSGDYLTYRATVDNESLARDFVHIDQYTDQITGTVPRLTVQRFFRDFHRYLFMPAFPGILFVCAFAFVLAISLYTGLKTTRNWKTALWRLRVNQGARILLSDTHKLAGLWGCWFVAVMVITGLWYLTEFGAAVADARFEPRGPTISENVGYDHKQKISPELFRIMAIEAQNVHGDWTIKGVLFPFSEQGTVQFRGVKDNPLLRDRAYRVFFNPKTGEQVDSWSAETIPTDAYLNEYADPLHFGYFGGIWTKLIWFVFGLALTAMSVTGVMMTWKRTKSSALTKPQIATLPILVLAAVAFFFWVQRYV